MAMSVNYSSFVLSPLPYRTPALSRSVLLFKSNKSSIFNLRDLFLIQSQPTPLNLTLRCSPKRGLSRRNFSGFSPSLPPSVPSALAVLLCSIFHFYILLLSCCAQTAERKRRKTPRGGVAGPAGATGAAASAHAKDTHSQPQHAHTHTHRQKERESEREKYSHSLGFMKKVVGSRASLQADTLYLS